MDERPGDKQGKMQLGAWSKEWISALIYHNWLAAVWERLRQRLREIRNNKWILGRGWASEPGFSGSSIISSVGDRWLCHSYLYCTLQRIYNCDSCSFIHSLFCGISRFSPCKKKKKCLRLMSYCLMFLFQFTSEGYAYMFPMHSLGHGPCRSSLGGCWQPARCIHHTGTMIGQHYIKHWLEVG